MNKNQIKQIYIEAGINGYKVNARVNWEDNEYFFSSYEEVLSFLKDLELPYKPIRNGEIYKNASEETSL